MEQNLPEERTNNNKKKKIIIIIVLSGNLHTDNGPSGDTLKGGGRSDTTRVDQSEGGRVNELMFEYMYMCSAAPVN
jgi:hypothetical protein